MAKPMAQEEFIRRAKAVHGDLYDYGRVEYRNMSHKVCIVCRRHGEFWQLPQPHLRGQGCPVCGDEKQRRTMLEKYGAENPMKVRKFFDKARETSLARYGHEWAMSNESVLEKRIATDVDKYGGRSPMASQDIRDKAHVTCVKKYGVENVMHRDEFRLKTLESKAANGTFHSSGSEETLYERLCGQFGEADVERQYTSDLYPFACDFYVKSRDLYIELNGSWTHGPHWFDSASKADAGMVELWLERGSQYYRSAARVWTDVDVRKRKTARQNGLNYVVFWDHHLRDASVWFAMGCPDGRDWLSSYSWLPDRRITGVPMPETVTGTSSNLSQVAKHYQFDTFYARELRLWSENPESHGLPLRVYLYANRAKYLGKGPCELSDAEIMRGFTISGLMKGYTVFDTKLMDQFMSKYKPSSVYDPCAGWGERMLYCWRHGIDYLGVDINRDLMPGYERMSQDFSLARQRVVCADSGSYVPAFRADAVFTCPPYRSIEKYSPTGAENLDEAGFLEWWGAVVRNALTTGAGYFAFQVNHKWRDRMLAVVQDNDLELADEFVPECTKASHFNRRNGRNTKRESECLLVLSKNHPNGNLV